jgi:hypothetical protein
MILAAVAGWTSVVSRTSLTRTGSPESSGSRRAPGRAGGGDTSGEDRGRPPAAGTIVERSFMTRLMLRLRSVPSTLVGVPPSPPEPASSSSALLTRRLFRVST